MKKLLSAVTVAFLLVGCSSQKQVEQKKEFVSEIPAKYTMENGLPVWVNNPDYAGMFGEVGIAKPQKNGGISAQKRTAIAVAKANLSKKMNIKIQSELNTEKKVINNDFESSISSLSKQESENLIENAQVEDMWLNENGELFVWIVIKK